MLRAGPLDKLVMLQQQVESRGGTYREVTRVWSDFAEVWAAIEPLSAREFFENQKVGGEITNRIRIRYLPGVTQNMRVVYGARVFELKAPPVNPREHNEQLELLCTEVFA